MLSSQGLTVSSRMALVVVAHHSAWPLPLHAMIRLGASTSK